MRANNWRPDPSRSLPIPPAAYSDADGIRNCLLIRMRNKAVTTKASQSLLFPPFSLSFFLSFFLSSCVCVCLSVCLSFPPCVSAADYKTKQKPIRRQSTHPCKYTIKQNNNSNKNKRRDKTYNNKNLYIHTHTHTSIKKWAELEVKNTS